MQTIIRNATVNDLKKIQYLNNDLMEFEIEKKLDNYVKDVALTEKSAKYFKRLIKEQIVFVAEKDNQIVGYLAGSITTNDAYFYYEGKTAELNNMFIKETERNLGIGTQLINSFVESCKKQEVKQILVTATIGNDNAINFYKRNGFNDINVTLRKKL